MEPIIDHIQITVRYMDVAVPFYDKLLPLLGFSPRAKSSAVIEPHDFHVVEYSHPRLSFAINSPRSAYGMRRSIGAGQALCTISPSRKNRQD